MRLTSFTDFGLRLLMRLAPAADQAFSTAERKVGFDLSCNRLTRIVATLAPASIAPTRHSGRGSAPLAHPAGQSSLENVLGLRDNGWPQAEYHPAHRGNCSIARFGRRDARMRSAKTAFGADLGRLTPAGVALPLPKTAMPNWMETA